MLLEDLLKLIASEQERNDHDEFDSTSSSPSQQPHGEVWARAGRSRPLEESARRYAGMSDDVRHEQPEQGGR